MTITEAVIQKLAKVGETFHSHDVMAQVDDMSYERLFLSLRRLRDQDAIVFTGTPCIWKRLK